MLSCCAWFEGLRSEFDAGFSIEPFREGERRVFKLVGRPLDRDVVRKYDRDRNWPELTNDRGGLEPFRTEIYLPIPYCPFCGTSLTKLIADHEATSTPRRLRSEADRDAGRALVRGLPA